MDSITSVYPQAASGSINWNIRYPKTSQSRNDGGRGIRKDGYPLTEACGGHLLSGRVIFYDIYGRREKLPTSFSKSHGGVDRIRPLHRKSGEMQKTTKIKIRREGSIRSETTPRTAQTKSHTKDMRIPVLPKPKEECARAMRQKN